MATSILHIYLHNSSAIKTIHQVVNITSTEAKLFTIRCGINQAVRIPNVDQIVVITDSLYAARRIFDSLLHSYQIQSASISHELRDFFNKRNNNHINFQNCLSKLNWILHSLVDKDTRKFNVSLIYLYKLSWDFCRKYNCDLISVQQRISFQVSDHKGKNFLKLCNDDLNSLEPSTIKGGLQFQHFGHLNTLCARAIRVIINHTPIGKY